ncbi:hypothetical protein ABIA03_007037 [Bradyrhizobium yuanmingense]|uniref:Uncharacterized protein n=1 Tax=Bradyrhizobium yuanmingense TaxID=108015 RepID=A0ABV4GVI7_9BRAD|nr:hypothetical protein [Bradyrhizobium yuanmingense]
MVGQPHTVLCAKKLESLGMHAAGIDLEDVRLAVALTDTLRSRLKHDWPLSLCGPEKREVAILGDENGRSGSGFIPDRSVGRIRHPELGYVSCIVSGATHGFRERRWKLSIDQEQQTIWPL